MQIISLLPSLLTISGALSTSTVSSPLPSFSLLPERITTVIDHTTLTLALIPVSSSTSPSTLSLTAPSSERPLSTPSTGTATTSDHSAIIPSRPSSLATSFPSLSSSAVSLNLTTSSISITNSTGKPQAATTTLTTAPAAPQNNITASMTTMVSLLPSATGGVNITRHNAAAREEIGGGCLLAAAIGIMGSVLLLV